MGMIRGLVTAGIGAAAAAAVTLVVLSNASIAGATSQSGVETFQTPSAVSLVNAQVEVVQGHHEGSMCVPDLRLHLPPGQSAIEATEQSLDPSTCTYTAMVGQPAGYVAPQTQAGPDGAVDSGTTPPGSAVTDSNTNPAISGSAQEQLIVSWYDPYGILTTQGNAWQNWDYDGISTTWTGGGWATWWRTGTSWVEICCPTSGHQYYPHSQTGNWLNVTFSNPNFATCTGTYNVYYDPIVALGNPDGSRDASVETSYIVNNPGGLCPPLHWDSILEE